MPVSLDEGDGRVRAVERDIHDLHVGVLAAPTGLDTAIEEAHVAARGVVPTDVEAHSLAGEDRPDALARPSDGIRPERRGRRLLAGGHLKEAPVVALVVHEAAPVALVPPVQLSA